MKYLIYIRWAGYPELEPGEFERDYREEADTPQGAAALRLDRLSKPLEYTQVAVVPEENPSAIWVFNIRPPAPQKAYILEAV